jgi:hypothetical protein
MLGEHPQGHSLTPKGIQQDMPQGHRSRGSPQGGQRPAEITTTWTIPCRSTLDHTVVQRRHSWALCLNHGDTHERSTFAEGMLHILDGGDRNDTTAGRIGCLNDGRCTFPLTPRKRGPNEWRNTCFLKSFFVLTRRIRKEFGRLSSKKTPRPKQSQSCGDRAQCT